MTREKEATGSDPNAALDARLPAAMALNCERLGAAKADMDIVPFTMLGILAGAFIAFGSIFMTSVLAGTVDVLPYGVVKLLGGVVFSLGLILVVIGGAELFTGDNLMVMAWAGGKIRARALLRAWGVVYVANFIGALGTVVLVFLAGQYKFGGAAVGNTALDIAQAKAMLPFTEALFLGILCNILVCLAVWMAFSAHTVVGKVVVIVPPIAAFVAAGFEHSIANMYFLPMGLLIKGYAAPEFWQAIGQTPDAYAGITMLGAARNLLAVTLGNIIGGGALVGIVYWFVYLRGR
jgi:formate transporter